VVQFGSFLDPIAILISLPLSLIGVMSALAITGETINIMSMIGLILLAGIVAKNAILLIDFAKVSREKGGLPLREALIEAGAVRLRPILMTTFALVAGMVPIALGSGEGAQFRAPLGVAVIGGGCSGLQYKMDLVDGPANRDIMVESNQVRVVVDPKSALFVSGSELDYSEDLQKGGFKVTNPNAVAHCSCGESFAA
jgi:iron-sulfur cluster assembly accessory protein